MKKLVFTIGLIFLVTPFCFAEDSIFLEGVEIKLGDKKVDVLPKIEKFTRVKESSDVSGIFLISSKDGSNLKKPKQ